MGEGLLGSGAAGPVSYKQPLASFQRGQTATTYFRRSGAFVRRELLCKAPIYGRRSEG
jgi:hypothetical protein